MKTAVLITARLKSTRLKQKAIKPIKGRAMIKYQIERLRAVRGADEIILCTSPLDEDSPLVEIAIEEGINYFRGDPDDVLVRLRDAAKKFGVDRIINVTADNPLIDPVYLDRLASFLTDNNYDYACTEGLPWGIYGWAMTYTAVIKACEIKAENDTEVWGGYFTQTGQFSHGVLKADAAHYWPELRLTVDTEQDFEVVSTIIDELYQPGELLSLDEILEYCRTHEALVALNSGVEQKKPKTIRLK